jgi:osmotically-inducible protein OsmY
MPQSLKQSVEEALQAYSPLRTSRSQIVVSVDGGQVTLSGYVQSTSTKQLAAILASGVDGVSEVVNALLAAPDLEQAVAMALAADSRTRPWPIRVRAEQGFVQLQGYVPDEQSIHVALEVARKVNGPQEIVNALKVGQPVQLAA